MKNREIKFRVWDKKQNKFIFNASNFAIDTCGRLLELEQRSGFTAGSYGPNGDWCFLATNIYRNGNNYITQQFTGLKDKNGAEIYEGDIVKFIDNEDILLLFCRYDVTNAWFTFGKLSDKIYEGYYWQEISHNCEIAGNIFENKELLG